MNQKMNPDVKAKWLTALRSGEYEQGEEVLNNVEANTFCCLGVLCEIALSEGLDIAVSDSDYSDGPHYAKAYDDETAVLPVSVMEWAGLTSTTGDYLNEKNEYFMLTAQNDEGATFEELALNIERYL